MSETDRLYTGEEPGYSQEQLKEVRLFSKVNKDNFYQVLGVERQASDAEIKKAYKKMALKFHPDKNRAPGADDAFKVVSRAFTTLADVDKRAAYDRFGVGAVEGNGGAPGAGFGRNPFGGGAGVFHQHFSTAGFGEDLSPEDVFNLFFQSAFGGAHQFQSQGNPFVFQSFGPGAFFADQRFFRAARPRQQRPATAASRADKERQEFLARIMQFVPLIILFVISIFSSWLFPSDSGTSNNPRAFGDIDHLVSLDAKPGFPFPRATAPNNFPYYASKTYDTYFKSMNKKLADELFKYESVIEKTAIKRLQDQCTQSQKDRQQAMRRAKNDPAEQERLRLEKESPSCARLRSIGYKIN